MIDDLDDDELVESPARVSKLFDWVRSALFGTLDGGRGRFFHGRQPHCQKFRSGEVVRD